jgi:hypothetical protein
MLLLPLSLLRIHDQLHLSAADSMPSCSAARSFCAFLPQVADILSMRTPILMMAIRQPVAAQSINAVHVVLFCSRQLHQCHLWQGPDCSSLPM